MIGNRDRGHKFIHIRTTPTYSSGVTIKNKGIPSEGEREEKKKEKKKKRFPLSSARLPFYRTFFPIPTHVASPKTSSELPTTTSMRVIRAMLPEEQEEMVDLLVRAFEQDPLGQWLFPEVFLRNKKHNEIFRTAIQESVLVDVCDDKSGIAIWQKKVEVASSQLENRDDETPLTVKPPMEQFFRMVDDNAPWLLISISHFSPSIRSRKEPELVVHCYSIDCHCSTVKLLCGRATKQTLPFTKSMALNCTQNVLLMSGHVRGGSWKSKRGIGMACALHPRIHRCPSSLSPVRIINCIFDSHKSVNIHT